MVNTLDSDNDSGGLAANAVATGSLAAKTVRGAGWMVTWRFLTRTLGAFSTFVLARLLSPMDFGLVALAGAFARAIDAMATLGIQDVMLREKHPDESYYSTGFTLGLIRGGIAGLVIAAAAYPVGRFFGDERLSYILLILEPLLLLESCENVGTLEFRRHFRFDRDFILFMVPRVASVVVTVGTAIVNQGIYKDTGLTALPTWIARGPHKTFAVGDSETDLPMFAVVERSFAPAHIDCARLARAVGCTVAETPYQRGLLEIVQRVTGADAVPVPVAADNLFWALLQAADQPRMANLWRALREPAAYRVFTD